VPSARVRLDVHCCQPAGCISRSINVPFQDGQKFQRTRRNVGTAPPRGCLQLIRTGTQRPSRRPRFRSLPSRTLRLEAGCDSSDSSFAHSSLLLMLGNTRRSRGSFSIQIPPYMQQFPLWWLCSLASGYPECPENPGSSLQYLWHRVQLSAAPWNQFMQQQLCALQDSWIFSTLQATGDSFSNPPAVSWPLARGLSVALDSQWTQIRKRITEYVKPLTLESIPTRVPYLASLEERLRPSRMLEWQKHLWGRIQSRSAQSNSESRSSVRATSDNSNRYSEWLAIVLTIGATALFLRWIYMGVHRYPTAAHLPPHYLALRNPRTGKIDAGRQLHGLVVHVGDGDNFRVLHTPWLLRWWIRLRWRLSGGQLPYKGNLSSQTIHVRLAGVDAPECAHFGLAGQRFGPQARAWLQRTLLNQPVKLLLYQRDRYGRIVAHVWRPRRIPLLGPLLPGLNVSLEMVRAGYAEVYRGAGACYGHLREALELAERQAQKRRLGMWARSGSHFLSCAGHVAIQSTRKLRSSPWQQLMGALTRPSAYKRLVQVVKQPCGSSPDWKTAPASRVATAIAVSASRTRHQQGRLLASRIPPKTTSSSVLQIRPRLLLRALSTALCQRSRKRHILGSESLLGHRKHVMSVDAHWVS